MNKFSNSESLEQDIKDGNILGMIEKMEKPPQPTTKTPRTDVVYQGTLSLNWRDGVEVLLKHASALELENQELRKEADNQTEIADAMTNYAGNEAGLIKQLTQLKAAGEDLRNSEDCPNCPNIGYTVKSVSTHACDGTEESCQMNCPVESQEQEQCQFCYENPKSRFKALTNWQKLMETMK